MRYTLLLSAVLIPGPSYAATFASFDVPGAYETCGSAISSNGIVAGNAGGPYAVGTASRTAHTAKPVTKSFVYANGRLSYPHANMPTGLLEFTGINRERVIVASAFNQNATAPAAVYFLYHHGQVTSPPASDVTVLSLLRINDNHALLGETVVPPSGGYPFPRPVGLILTKTGDVTLIDDGKSEISPLGMDANARIVVGTSLGVMSGGWVFKAGKFAPVSYPGSAFTTPSGVDKQGTISGSYTNFDPASGDTATHGFFLRNGIYTTYDVPVTGATATSIGAMNESGQITGCYVDATGTHGFLQTP